MNRISLTNGNGAWFDAEKADLHKENQYHDGRNWISKATKDQFTHEAIYMTKSGKFILNKWSQWQGSVETYEEISKAEAAAWFAKQDFQDNEIPDIFLPEVTKLEIV